MKKTQKKSEKIRFLPIEKIVLNPLFSGRYYSDPEPEVLVNSIRLYGMLQPLTVRRRASEYELVCGNRRLKAAALLGQRVVPCRILKLSHREAAELFLSENLNRSSLCPFEEGLIAARLLKAYPYRQGELAVRIGESPSELSAKLRLLRFTREERRAFLAFGLDPSYAEPLLHLRETSLRLLAMEHVACHRLSPEEAVDYCLSLSLHREEFIPPLRTAAVSNETPVRRFILKDVGFFINSVDRAIDSIREAGFDVDAIKDEEEDYISYSIKIPK
ncbi:MAG: ParB/RepB/Spo0J family partition protein [Clostridia bacterium]|nr:ParB/RepB/Spo0J family partition protein [Clostridia bacterium]